MDSEDVDSKLESVKAEGNDDETKDCPVAVSKPGIVGSCGASGVGINCTNTHAAC